MVYRLFCHDVIGGGCLVDFEAKDFLGFLKPRLDFGLGVGIVGGKAIPPK